MNNGMKRLLLFPFGLVFCILWVLTAGFLALGSFLEYSFRKYPAECLYIAVLFGAVVWMSRW